MVLQHRITPGTILSATRVQNKMNTPQIANKSIPMNQMITRAIRTKELHPLPTTIMNTTTHPQSVKGVQIVNLIKVCGALKMMNY